MTYNFRYNNNLPRFSMPTIHDARAACSRGPWLLVAVWLSLGILAVLIPIARWRGERNEYYQAYGYAIEYEQAQRAYEEAQREQEDGNQGWYYETCKWYDYACRKAAYRYRQNNGNGNNNDANDVNMVPNWYLFLGGQTEEGRREMEEQGNMGNTASLNFVYTWTVLMFVAILLFGTMILVRTNTVGATSGLLVLLVVFFQFLLLNMLLLVQGVIQTDGRALEDSVYGWFGQTSILLVYTDFWILLFCTIFTIVLAGRIVWQWRQERVQRIHAAQKEAELNTSYVHIESPAEATDARLT
jgi:uncharacterized Tic20 family protein